MRDSARLLNRTAHSNPRWGHITRKMLAHTNTRHGPLQLYAINGSRGYSSANGGYDFVSGNRWGTPMYRYSNGAGVDFVPTGAQVVFPHAGKRWPWLLNRDWTFAIVARVGHPSFVDPKKLLLFHVFYTSYGIEWLNASEWRCKTYRGGVLQETLRLHVLDGTIWDRWFGLVVTGTKIGSSPTLTFYAGSCDGEWFDHTAGDQAWSLVYPNFVRFSSWLDEKTHTGWNGEVGGFLWTEGAWAESEVRRWIMNPFAWTENYGQKLMPIPACMQADADVDLSLNADAGLDPWTEADAHAGLAIDGDVDLSCSVEADGDVGPVLVADADICPEDRQ